MTNLLANPGFEGNWWRKTHTGQEYGEIFVPEGWTAWWKEGLPVPHDPDNHVGYGRPEMQVINAEPPFLDPPRVDSGNRALKFFTFYRIHEAGLYQVVATTANRRYGLSLMAHAWSASLDDPHESDDAPGAFYAVEGTAGLTDAQRNFTFCVGVDRTGGTDPWAPTVEWGKGAHIYNVYARVPTLEFTATVPQTTIFLRSSVLWPFKHCDAYMDSAELVEIDAPGPSCQPREDFHCVYALIPPEHGFEWFEVLRPEWEAHRFTIGGSADHAAYMPGVSKRTVLALNPAEWPGNLLEFFSEYYPDVTNGVLEYVPIEAVTPEEWLAGVHAYYNPSAPPMPSGPCTEKGTKLGLHSLAPTTTIAHAAGLSQAGAPLPVYKAVADWASMKPLKQASPNTLIIGRFVADVDGVGDLSGDKTDAEIAAMAQSVMAGYHALLAEQQNYDGGRLQFIDWFELLNEIDAPGVDGYRNLARLMIKMVEIGEQWNLPIHKFACFGMNNGTPEWDEIVAMVETGLLEKMVAGGHILTLHEGAFPFSDPIDKWWGDPIPGAPEVERAGALCGRYRYWLYLAQQRGVYLPIVISEFYPGPDYDLAHADEVLARIAWYDELVRQDPEVLAFLPFTNAGAGHGWPQQDCDPFLPSWATYAIAIKDRQNALPGVLIPPQPPITPEVVAYRQSDPLWGGLVMLPSAHLMKNKGCLVTGVAINATLVDKTVTPGTLCIFLREHNGFTASGGLIFRVVEQYLPWMKFKNYVLWGEEGCTSPAIVEEALSHGPTILKVDWDVGDTDIDSHFVWCKGWTDDTRTDIECIDPWTGEWTTILNAYPRGNIWQSVFGVVDYEIVGAPESPRVFEVGVHSAPIPFPTVDISVLIQRLQALGIKQYKLLDDGNPGNVPLIQALLSSGITPVVRMFQQGQFPGRLAEPLRERAYVLRAAGVDMFEIANEPNLSNEWQNGAFPVTGWQDTDVVNQTADNWWADVMEMIGHGCKVAFPAMAPTDRGGTNSLYSSVMWARKMLDWIGANHRQQMTQFLQEGKVWLAVHTSPFTRPFDYSPVQPWGTDDMCLLGYEPLQAYFRLLFGITPLTISTEGGVYSPSHIEELGWYDAPYNWDSWGDYTWAMHNFLAQRGTLNGMHTWVLSDEGSPWWPNCGWYDQYGNPRTPITTRL